MDEAGKKRLLEEYAANKRPETREQLILEYAPLVKAVAGRLSMYLGYNVDYEDLVSYGIFGLIDAIDKFDCLKEVKFETYASLRIRGAILDQIRKMDWIPRTIRQRQKKIDAVIKEVEQTTGRSATDEDIAAGLGISSEEYLDWQSQMKITGLVSLNEYMDQARIVITHGGPSSIMMALQRGKIPIVVPRQKQYEEHVNDHQVEFSRFIEEKQKNIIVVEEIDTLEKVITSYEKTAAALGQKQSSNNQRFNEKFEAIVDKLFEGKRR